jgi:hypothetical protein
MPRTSSGMLRSIRRLLPFLRPALPPVIVAGVFALVVTDGAVNLQPRGLSFGCGTHLTREEAGWTGAAS